MPSSSPTSPPNGWQRFAARAVELFHVYANWLVSITWKRFFLLAVLLLIGSLILKELPPFSYRITELTDEPIVVKPPTPPKAPKAPAAARSTEPAIRIEKQDHDGRDVTISIDRNGVRITPTPRPRTAASAASDAASAARSAAAAASAVASDGPSLRASRDGGVEIKLPPGADSEEVRGAIDEARQAIVEAIRESGEKAADAAEATAEKATAETEQSNAKTLRSVRRLRSRPFGDFLTSLAWFLILASAIIKITYKSTVQAETKAAVATETAESEQLKRQVVEARMAAMQAQVEPHFLFNTLASIDHLIETDPPRASQMQKNLIALLRASMPTLREAPGTSQTLGRELAVVRPYLEILKVRMEDRLASGFSVPEGLLSAEFPSMMIQSLVENAIKHGLEPKPEGGRLDVKAEIVDGKLVVSVADTGLGFGQARAETAGTGTGLANIRERLLLLYGDRAAITVADNTPTGTVVTITVPYQAQQTAPREGSKP